jgi:hypothetical protein
VSIRANSWAIATHRTIALCIEDTPNRIARRLRRWRARLKIDPDPRPCHTRVHVRLVFGQSCGDQSLDFLFSREAMWAHADPDTRPAPPQQGTVQSELPILVLSNDLMGHTSSLIAPGHRGTALRCFRPPLLLDQIVAVTQTPEASLVHYLDHVPVKYSLPSITEISFPESFDASHRTVVAT